jgi:hypothetical protein
MTPTVKITAIAGASACESRPGRNGCVASASLVAVVTNVANASGSAPLAASNRASV